MNYGIVTKAKHKNQNEICAIKIIEFNSEDNESLLREIKITSDLKSDYIVKLESLWTEDNYLINTGYEKMENWCQKILQYSIRQIIIHFIFK